MWDSHKHLTKAIRFDSGINNGGPLGNVLLYIRENCGCAYFILASNMYLVFLTPPRKKVFAAWRLKISCLIHLRCSVMKSFMWQIE